MTVEDLVLESIGYIREHTSRLPRIGIILGSGLGDFADGLSDKMEISTKTIPHYPQSTVEGHKGKLVFASHDTKDVLVFQGRIHFYECNSVDTLLYPIRIANALGIKTLIVTNAAGGVNRTFEPGDLMVMTDHINLTGVNVFKTFSQRRDGGTQYSPRLITLLEQASVQSGIKTKKGIYAGVKGPSYETAAEVEMIHRIGGDAVGMSTVLEVGLACAFGMNVLGISCITNKATGISGKKLSHGEVSEVANRVKTDFAKLLSKIIELL